MNKVQGFLDSLKINSPEDLNKDLWIWGIGNTAEMAQEGLRRWKRFDQVKGYIDSNPEKWGGMFYGKPIVAPKSVEKKEDVCILICTNQLNYLQQICSTIKTLDISNWYILDEFVLFDLKDEVIKSYNSFTDDKSKLLYEYLVNCKLNGKYPSIESGLLEQGQEYFSLHEFTRKDKDEIFVDVGCYTGDTIEEYLSIKDNCFKKIYAFEPDRHSYEIAKKNIKLLSNQRNISEDKINLFPYGVGEKTEQGVFERFEETEGAGSKFVTGKDNDTVYFTKVVALDDFLKEGFDFLKADVESYEYQVIMGAAKIISTKSPRLAICLYHNVFDFIQIPHILKELVPSYKIYLRQHAPAWYDTVLYATKGSKKN